MKKEENELQEKFREVKKRIVKKKFKAKQP